MKKFHFVSLLFSVLLISCSMLNQTSSSSIVVNLPQTATRGPAPDFVSYYKVTASCEEVGFNKTEIPEKGKSSVEFINLKAGTYKVQVVAFTADDEKVAEGEDTVEVAAGEVAVAKILLEMDEPEIWEEGFDMGLSVYNPALSVWYESDVENEFIQDANAPVEIPYKNENLVIRLSNVGDEFEEIEFKLNNGNIESDDPYTIKINPYENVLLTLDGTNVLSCFVTDGRISKSVSFIFRFTDTGL